MSKKVRNFLNDADGLSAKDYLLLITTAIFFGFMAIGLILILLGKPIDQMYLDLLNMADNVVMTVVGGVMGVQVAETIVNKKTNETTKEIKEDKEESF